MSKNVAQIYSANPVTTIGASDLVYVGQSGTTDAAINGTNLAATLSPLTTKGDLYTYTTTNARLAVGSTNGQIVQVLSSASTGLAWSTATYPSTTTINQLLYSSSANTITGLATANSSVLVTSAGGVPSLSTTLPSGLTIPGYQTTITPAALTSSNDTNVTLTLGGTPTTALLQAASITAGWTGTLSGTRGGTGVNNGASTITIGGNVTFSGAFTFAGTITNTTAVTFPTSGTLATTSQINQWVDETGSSVTMVTNTGYTSDDGASLVTFTLPTTSAIGDWVEINGKGTGLWTIAQATGQQIHINGSATTSGASGSLSSVGQFDNVRLRCLTANTIWTVVSQQSTGLTVV